MSAIGKGYDIIVEDGVLDTSGQAVAVYGINIISDGTAGDVNLRSGTAVTGDIIMTLTGTASTGVYIDLGAGVVFPTGCYVDIDAHVTPSCTLVYERI